MSRLLSNHQHLWPVFALFCCLFLLLYAPRLNSDGAYYYEFARSMVIQNDLNFDDEREFYTWEWVPVFRDFSPGDWKDTGYVPNIFSFGPAVIWIPVFWATHAIVQVSNSAGIHLLTTGYSMIYRFPVTLLSVLAGVLILMILDRISENIGYERKDRQLGLFLILGASHLPAFLFVTPAFSHALSTWLSCMFFYLWFVSRDEGWNWSGYGFFGLVAGSMVLARWQNLFSLLLPAVDALSAIIIAPSKKIALSRAQRWMVFLAVFAIVITPQLIVTTILYGKPVTDPQGTGGMRWFDPWFGLVLFEATKGLLTVNPILLIGLLGLPLVFRKNYRLGWGLCLFFIIHLYINAVRRDWSGVGFGMRRFLDVLPVFTLGLIAILDYTRASWRKIVRYLVIASGMGMIVWNFLLMAQYYLSELGAPWVTLPFKVVSHRIFSESPELLAELFQTSLLGTGLRGSVTGLVFGTAGFFILLIAIYKALNQRSSGNFIPQKAARIIIGALIYILSLDVWLIGCSLKTQSYSVIDLTPGKQWGYLRHLKLNPSNGYLGSPSGIEFKPDHPACRIKAQKQYSPKRFLDHGTLISVPESPCLETSNVEFFYLNDQLFSGIQLISTVDRTSPSSKTPVAEIVLRSATGSEIRLPVREGFETGCSQQPDRIDETKILLRHPSYATNYGPYRYQRTYFFDDPITIRSIQLNYFGRINSWLVEGIALINCSKEM